MSGVSVVNPLAQGPVVLVSAVGGAEGARPAAAALACAGAELDQAALLIDVGGRPARPTLVASAAAQKLEERLVAHLPDRRVAARGQICQVSVPADDEGLATAVAAVSLLREGVAVVHLPTGLLPQAHGPGGLHASGALIRADLEAERPLVALAVRALMDAGLAVAVLKERLGWVTERRALFGALPAAAPGGLPERQVARLLRMPSGCRTTGLGADVAA